MTSLTWKRLGLVLWLKLLQVATSGFWNTSLLSKQLLVMCLSLSYAQVKLTLGSCCFAIAVLLCLWGFWCVCVCGLLVNSWGIGQRQQTGINESKERLREHPEASEIFSPRKFLLETTVKLYPLPVLYVCRLVSYPLRTCQALRTLCC